MDIVINKKKNKPCYADCDHYDMFKTNILRLVETATKEAKTAEIAQAMSTLYLEVGNFFLAKEQSVRLAKFLNY